MQVIHYCFGQFRLTVIALITSAFLILGSFNAYCQQRVESFTIDNCNFKHDRQQLTKVVKQCSDYLNKITLTVSGKKIYEVELCGVDESDVRFIHKGYLTVLERYSSAAGWFEYTVFDLCKKRIITTRRVEEGTAKFAWEEFIKLEEPFKTKYVDKVKDF